MKKIQFKKIEKECTGRASASRTRGIALLFTVLVTSMLLLVALDISNIAYKELIFSSEARDSDKAFFAADTGIECALYLDKPTTANPTGIFAAAAPSSSLCGGTTSGLISGPTAPYTTYQFIVGVGTSQCAQVTVDKTYDDGTGTLFTRFQSIGYNVPAPAAGTVCVVGTPGPRVVTRALQTKYQNPAP